METVEDVLAHFGVKGMKWGVRKARDTSGKPSKPEKMSKLTDDKGRHLTKSDEKWVNSSTNHGKGVAAYNKAARAMNDKHIDRINNKPAYKNADFNKDSPLRRKYYKEYEDTFNKEFNSALKETFGDSPSGRYTIKSASNMDSGMLPAWSVEYAEVKHADFEMKVLVTFDKGRIVKIALGEPIIKHYDVDAFLEHFGVKGMKWGIRKDKLGGSRGSSESASSDAARARATQDMIKKHGTSSVDNKDLQHLVTRMNLERQYNGLVGKDTPRVKKGLGFAKEFIGVGKMAQDAYNLANGPLAKAIGKAIKEHGAK